MRRRRWRIRPERSPDPRIGPAQRTKCESCDAYSYRSDSTGVISAARWAGYMPAVTVIKESVRIEATIEIQETIGGGRKRGRGGASMGAHIPMPKESPRTPLTMVR